MLISVLFICTVHIEDLYCFHYTSSLDDIPRSAGWSFFDLETEFQRMGVPNANWTLTNLNTDYQVNLAAFLLLSPVPCDDLHQRPSLSFRPINSAGWSQLAAQLVLVE